MSGEGEAVIVSHIDPDSRSTIAAADGFHALGRGDTVLARQKFTEAGKTLEAGAVRTASLPEKNLLRFLAASQYYHGGEYQRAKRIVQRTRPKYLSEEDQEKFEAFRNDVEERAAAGYPARIRAAVLAAWKQGQWDAALKLFQHHPYVVERSMLAWLRADLCYQLRKWKAAALFYSDAIRFSDSQPRFVFMRASGALRLHAEGRTDVAEEYLRFLLTKEPTALDLVAGCAVQFSKLLAGERTAGPKLLGLFEEAERAFGSLPQITRNDPGVRALMSHGYLVAALTQDEMGDRTSALSLIEAGIAFAPTGPEIDAFRAILSDPGKWFDRWAPQVATIPASLAKSVQPQKGELEAVLRNAA